MELLDIHTHNIASGTATTIFSSGTYLAGRNISIGIHPWKISDDWEQQFAIVKEYAGRENVIAIGECGIDKVTTSTGIDIQRKIFKAHAILAEEVEKPLVIHCVKGFDEIISIHKEIKPRQMWIIHGFRGKPQQAEQLTKAGFYLSFGEKFNTDGIKATPVEKLLVESDESTSGISEIYSRIANAKGISVNELASAVLKNAARCNLLPRITMQ